MAEEKKSETSSELQALAVRTLNLPADRRELFQIGELERFSSEQVELFKWYVEREMCKRDLFYLALHVLDYKLLYEPIHRAMAESVTSKRRTRFVGTLWPRGHYKTTLVTIAGIIYRVINNPDIRVLMAHSVLDLSRAMLREMKEHFTTNPKFRRLFPEFCPPVDKALFGTQDAFTVPCRKRIRREPTVRVGAADQTLASAHFDHITFDDVVDEKNSKTDNGRKKVHLFYQTCLPLLDPGGTIDMIGTRWHDGDLYGTIIGKRPKHWSWTRRVLRERFSPELEPEYILPKRQVEVEDGRFVPSGFDKEEEDILREEMDDLSLFMAQYYNDPICEATAKFKKSNLQRWESLPQGIATHTTVDPAISDKDGSCYTAIVTVVLTRDGYFYVAEVKRLRVELDELLTEVFETVMRLGSNVVGIEDVAYQKVILKPLREMQLQSGTFFAVTALKDYRSKDKDYRIEHLIPYWNSGRIFLGPGQQDLENEILRYPKAKYRDCLDALAYQVELARHIQMRTPSQHRRAPDRSGVMLDVSDFPAGTWGERRAELSKRAGKRTNDALVRNYFARASLGLK